MSKNSQCKSDNEYTKNSLNILDIQEADRRRIARELHDSSLQKLAHTLHKLELCDLYMDSDILRAKMELLDITQSIRTVISEIRDTIFNLRPMAFDDLGIEQAFEEFLQSVNSDNEFEIISDIKPVQCNDEIILITIYRIFQECINNCLKHSRGSKIIFRCGTYENVFYMNVEDNGIGFVEKEHSDKTEHFGLSIMKERVKLLNGKMNIKSSKSVGTQISIEIPL